MKIFFISYKNKGGEPKRGISYAYHNLYDALVKMNNGGNEIIYFLADEVIEKVGKERIDEKLLETVYQEKPNLVFFDAGAIKKETLKEITEKSGAITFIWISDDHWMFDRSSKYLAPLFHWTVTSDSQAPAKYHKAGFKNVIHGQWACNHFYYKPLNLPKIYDVTFIGQPHGAREKIIRKIKEAGIDVKCWGYGWPAGAISQTDMLRVFSQSKINLNFSMSSGAFWKRIANIFLKRGENRIILVDNPKNWPGNFKSMLGSFRAQIKGRNFEIPGSGSFLLTDYADNLGDYFEIGKEIVCFNGIKDLVGKIKYYLAHDEEREAIAKAGYVRTLRDHTYEKRFNEIFKIMGLVK